MSLGDQVTYINLLDGFQKFEKEFRPLPGIANEAARDCLIRQIIASLHRVKYPARIRQRQLSPLCADPSNSLFDPLKAAIIKERAGDIDDAFWLVFLFVHFGKHRTAGWRYSREIYGRLGQGGLWDWSSTSASPSDFRRWLAKNQEAIRKPGGFGNHRKYQSLDAFSDNGTGNAIQTYINWVHPPRTHPEIIQEALLAAKQDPFTAFNLLYHSLEAVASFGRTAKFDYLTMLGKIGLAPIAPGTPYLRDSTGPVRGASLLFGKAPIGTLEQWAIELDSILQIGMQAMEDSICNWQKCPTTYIAFTG